MTTTSSPITKLLNTGSSIYTLVGVFALLIWSMTALINVWLRNIPALQLLTMTFSICFITSVISLTLKRRWHIVRQQSWQAFFFGFLGICGTQFCFVSAFRFAPPEQVDLINYLWPVMVIILSGFLPDHSFSWKDLVSALLGFFGIYLLLMGEGKAYYAAYIPGYSYALLAALCWTSYTLFCRNGRRVPGEMVGIYCGVAGVLSFAACPEEVMVSPTAVQWFWIFFIGMGVFLVSYPCWNLGVKKGNFT
ncbi:MAG: DMT family transporter, partial [Chlamydiota bacterium]